MNMDKGLGELENLLEPCAARNPNRVLTPSPSSGLILFIGHQFVRSQHLCNNIFTVDYYARMSHLSVLNLQKSQCGDFPSGRRSDSQTFAFRAFLHPLHIYTVYFFLAKRAAPRPALPKMTEVYNQSTRPGLSNRQNAEWMKTEYTAKKSYGVPEGPVSNGKLRCF